MLKERRKLSSNPVREPLDVCGRRNVGPDRQRALSKTAREMASQALRVLAIAYKSNATLEDCEHNMVFVGLVGMIDPPRSEARTAIQQCEQAGIKPVMITGDHPVTAQAVARRIGPAQQGPGNHRHRAGSHERDEFRTRGRGYFASTPAFHPPTSCASSRLYKRKITSWP